jgi:hypothetical protein
MDRYYNSADSIISAVLLVSIICDHTRFFTLYSIDSIFTYKRERPGADESDSNFIVFSANRVDSSVPLATSQAACSLQVPFMWRSKKDTTKFCVNCLSSETQNPHENLIIILYTDSTVQQLQQCPSFLKVRGPLHSGHRITQFFDSTPDNSTFNLFNSDTFNFRSIKLLDNSTQTFPGQSNSEQFNSVLTKCMHTSFATNKGYAHDFCHELFCFV